MYIHFFAEGQEHPGESFTNWSPDTQPELFCDGFGHNIVELAKRLEWRGHIVSFGSTVPDIADLVVFFKYQLAMGVLDSIKQVRASMRVPSVHVRSDLPWERQKVFEADIEVVPNHNSLRRSNQVFLLPLAQRGLLESTRQIDEPIEQISVKCFPQNVHVDFKLLETNLRERLPNVKLVLDVHSETSVPPNKWHDFREVDVSLIYRPINWGGYSDSRKPPTRLINAWLAGTIPFVQPIESYSNLVRDGKNAFIVRNIDEIVGKIKFLNENPEELKNVRMSVLKMKDIIEPLVEIELWEEMFYSVKNGVKISANRNIKLLLGIVSSFLVRMLSRLKLRIVRE